MTIRLLLIDDHPIVRAGLRAVLDAEPDLEVVGEADTATRAISLAHRLRPDLILTDLLLPDQDGIAVTQRVRAELPETQVVILTSVGEEDTSVVRAVQSGAMGYVLKSANIGELLQTVHSAAQGQVHLTARAAARLVQEMRSPEQHGLLSDRERDVLRELAIGRTNKEIARSLDIALTTVKSHVRSILDKLGVDSRTQAALYVTTGASSSLNLAGKRHSMALTPVRRSCDTLRHVGQAMDASQAPESFRGLLLRYRGVWVHFCLRPLRGLRLMQSNRHVRDTKPTLTRSIRCSRW
jgi:NarL family two-component system response regulator LiaR